MDENMTTYIYGLFCPVAGCIRYIGKTTNPKSRLITHVVNARKQNARYHAAHWIRSLLALDLRPEMLILETLEAGEDWAEYERFYIEHGEYFGWNLTNTTPGGEGGGFVRPEDKAEWVERVRVALAAPEVRDKISKGVVRALARPETKAKQSANMTARWLCPEYRARMDVIKEQLAKDPDVIARRSAAAKETWSCPKRRKETSVRNKAYYATEEGKQNKLRTSGAPEKVAASREGQVKNWQDPAYRESQMAAKTTVEVIEKQKQGAKNQWADPEIRARMVAAIRLAGAKRREKRLAGKIATESNKDKPCA